ncbi:hypothetical protein AA313_de0201816 [Arthrobotrys entomopaga]|nr:hypothetical protein AA313_de0201816 [Arthrobotrys entomopaga]
MEPWIVWLGFIRNGSRTNSGTWLDTVVVGMCILFNTHKMNRICITARFCTICAPRKIIYLEKPLLLTFNSTQQFEVVCERLIPIHLTCFVYPKIIYPSVIRIGVFPVFGRSCQFVRSPKIDDVKHDLEGILEGPLQNFFLLLVAVCKAPNPLKIGVVWYFYHF